MVRNSTQHPMYSDSTSTIQSVGPSSHSPPETEGTQSEPMQIYNGGRSLLQVLVVDSREVHKGRVVVTLGVTHVFFQHVVFTSGFAGADCWRENVSMEATFDRTLDKGQTKGFTTVCKWLS